MRELWYKFINSNRAKRIAEFIVIFGGTIFIVLKVLGYFDD